MKTTHAQALKDKIAHEGFPCLMAKTVFNHDNARRIQCEDMADTLPAAVKGILARFYQAADSIRSKKGYYSIILEFDRPEMECEQQFEGLIWKFLQALHDEDGKHYAWDPNVDSDPHSPGYNFSLQGQAFYIIGMHPKSSRIARRTEKATLVFNPHAQFEKLRDMGAYTTVRDKIRKRDVAYSGSVNPMLEDFGASSEAAQYSGRNFIKALWKCPFQPRK